MHMYNWMFLLFTKYVLHVLAFTASFSGRNFITSQNHLLVVRLLQWLSYRARNVSCGFLQSCLQLLKQYCLVVMTSQDYPTDQNVWNIKGTYLATTLGNKIRRAVIYHRASTRFGQAL